MLGATGCFRINATTGAEVPAERVAGIVPGQTTRDEVLRWFGAPTETTDGAVLSQMVDSGDIDIEDLKALPFADLLVFEITDGKARILFTFVFNYFDIRLTRDRLVVFFDEDDRVLYYGVTRQRAGAEEDEEPDEAAE